MVGLLIQIAVVFFVCAIFQPLLMCTRRLGVTGLIIVFVSDYMLKKTRRGLNYNGEFGRGRLGYCFACNYT